MGPSAISSGGAVIGPFLRSCLSIRASHRSVVSVANPMSSTGQHTPDTPTGVSAGRWTAPHRVFSRRAGNAPVSSQFVDGPAHAARALSFLFTRLPMMVRRAIPTRHLRSADTRCEQYQSAYTGAHSTANATSRSLADGPRRRPRLKMVLLRGDRRLSTRRLVLDRRPEETAHGVHSQVRPKAL